MPLVPIVNWPALVAWVTVFPCEWSARCCYVNESISKPTGSSLQGNSDFTACMQSQWTALTEQVHWFSASLITNSFSF